MKKSAIILSLISMLLLVLFLGIFTYKRNFFRVDFTDDRVIGGIIKYEDETVKGIIYTSVYNGSFSNKAITFEVGGGEEYQRFDLKYDKYYNVQIKIIEGNARVSEQGNCITIPPGETVMITISAFNEYIGDEYKGKLVNFSRGAPEDVRIVIVE